MFRSINFARSTCKSLQKCYKFSILTNSRLSSSSKTIKNAKILDQETVRILFSDGNYCDFKNIWLRDSCKCEKCLDKITQHKLFEISYAYSDIKPQINNLKVDPDTGNINIEWSSSNEPHSHTSSYFSSWLYQFSPVFSKNFTGEKPQITDRTYASPLPPVQLWNKALIEKQNLNTDYKEFMETKEGLKTVLGNVYKYGIALVKGAPAKKGEIFKITDRIGHVMETGYGKTFQVAINPHPKTHLTYTGKKFEFHTDLSYMRNSPTMQLLHCIKANTIDGEEVKAGGISFFADAFKAIEWLRTAHPEHFEILSNTQIKLTYLDAQRNRWFRTERTLIQVNGLKEVTEFFCSDFSLRPPLLPLEKIVPFYEAYHCLMNKINTDEYVWKFFLKKGDVVIFDNARVLHGRDEYDPSKIDRHLEGVYMDLQEAMSLYESLSEE